VLKEHSSIGRACVAVLDGLLIAGAFYLAHAAFGWESRLRYGVPAPPAGRYAWLLAVFIPVALVLLNHYGLLVAERSRGPRQVLDRVGRAFLLTGIVLSGVIFVTKARYYSRFLLASHWLLAGGLVLAEKLLLHYACRRDVLSFAPVRRAALVGQGREAERLRDQLLRDPAQRLAPGAEFDLSADYGAFQRCLLEQTIDVVYFVLPEGWGGGGFPLERFLACCEELGVPATVVPNLDGVFRYFAASLAQLEATPAVVFHPPTLDPDRALVKRAMDVAGACVGLGLTALLTPFIALAIRLDSRGPVFFGQERVGRNGRRFTLHKFRTMREGAEGQKAALGELNEMRGPVFKLSDDPRVTRVGRLLRRLSLDELPQFWNVLKGEMSLVGTRPPTPHEVEQYELWHYRRLSIRPGMTGLWQVSGRSDVTDFRRIVQLDLRYIDEWSLWLDVRILARTLLAAAKGR
jgi:exopolysaccharide biosynthesis polyprenyl glycosylphosphotransferase